MKVGKKEKITRLGSVFALEHYANNIKQEKTLVTGKYINKQEDLSGMKFGVSDIPSAGCELIAIYNAIKMKTGKTVRLSDIIFQCETNGYTLGYGGFGTNVYSIGKLLTKFGVSYKKIRNSNKSMSFSLVD